MIERILIGLIEHMGDIVACEPVSRYIRYNNPNSEIIWAVSPQYRELIDVNPHIDNVVTIECLTDWMKLSSHGNYDLVVDLHVNYRICEHCQIPLTKRSGNPFINVYEWFDHGALLEAFSLGAGLPRLSAQPRLYLGPEHIGAVDALQLPDDFCVVHRFSNSADKDWTADGWRALSSIIQNELGLTIVEVGAGKLADSLPAIDGAINLVNRLPILQTAEVINRSRFFVGIDSGPAHLANAQHVPGIILLGRLGYFRQYSPYTGFYAGTSSQVKIVRNLVGPVRDLSLDAVAEAVRYVNASQDGARRGAAHFFPSSQQNRWLPPHKPGSDAILKSGLFDVGWYALHYPETTSEELHPIDHYLLKGAALGYNPSATFNTKDYLEVATWLVETGDNPLLHYITNGWHEGIRLPAREMGPDGAQLARTATDVVPPVTTISKMLAASSEDNPQRHDERNAGAKHDIVAPRIFAFYLPQFHPIPENSWAHGNGFTEWHNVIKAKPLFRGHYQPRIPGELGFYDLRAEQTMREQIRLAQEHGVSGFCFYYYYFQGRKLLYAPVDNFVRSDIDAPFLLLWANENWSKRWDGGDREIIIAQQHSAEDDLAFLRELAPLFHDRRYVKVDGKPVLMIYKTHLFPDIVKSVEIWRTEIINHGFPGIYLIMADDWNGELHHPRDTGFDASYEIPSNVIPSEVLSTETDDLELVDDFTGHIVDYEKFAGYHLGRPFPIYKRFRTVMLPWDNTSRYGSRAIVHINGHGESYKLWLLQALLDTHRRHAPDERFIFLHSWNEWCEGTYIEPDGKYGRFFLEQTKEAVEIVREALRKTAAFPGEQLAAELLKLQAAKDEGAFRVMLATRKQAHYAWGDLVREREERANLRDERSYLLNEVNNFHNQENHLRHELIRLQNDLNNSNNKSEDLHHETTNLKNDLINSNNQLENLRYELNILQSLIGATLSSRSWRLTWPLRKAVMLLRGR